jgi:hypothetical protein
LKCFVAQRGEPPGRGEDVGVVTSLLLEGTAHTKVHLEFGEVAVLVGLPAENPGGWQGVHVFGERDGNPDLMFVHVSQLGHNCLGTVISEDWTNQFVIGLGQPAMCSSWHIVGMLILCVCFYLVVFSTSGFTPWFHSSLNQNYVFLLWLLIVTRRVNLQSHSRCSPQQHRTVFAQTIDDKVEDVKQSAQEPPKKQMLYPEEQCSINCWCPLRDS